MVVVGAIAAAGVGAVGSIVASNTAASAQTAAAKSASDTQMTMFNKTQANLQPYMNLGTIGTNQLTQNFDALTAPITMSQSDLEKTPGYQFNLSQGLKAVQNSAAARGLGTSGAALKGAAGYATGLADSTYQNQFNNALTNRNLKLGVINSMVGTGENAAAGVGNAAIATGNSIASNTMGAANAQAGAAIATGNALTGFGGSVANSLLTAKTAGLFSPSTVVPGSGQQW